MNRRDRRKGQAKPLASAKAVQPTQAAPIVVEKKPDTVTVRTAAISLVMPQAVWNGRLAHPDPVLRQFGGPYGIAFYRLMMQENLGLSADCSQYEDRTNAIDRVIRPGDPDSDMSIEMAKAATKIFSRIPSSNIVNLWLLRARWYGLASIGKAGWKKDPETGLLAPFDVYNIDPWRWRFGPNFEPYLLTARRPWDGEPIPLRSVFFARWGSNFHPYGESDLRDVYLSAWYMQRVTEFLLHSIEVLGRPIPWIEVADTLEGEEFDGFEKGIASQYKYYVITRTPGATTGTTFPNSSVLANGSAGKSELEFVRYHAGLVSRKILGTQQTQDKVGGSRALETTRMEIAHDKTPPASQLIDQAWTEGWLNDIGLINWPNQPRQFWPVMDSGASDLNAEPLTGSQMVALGNLAEQLRLKQVTKTWAVTMLVRAKFKRTEAEAMVASMLDPKSGLSKELSRGDASQSVAALTAAEESASASHALKEVAGEVTALMAQLAGKEATAA